MALLSLEVKQCRSESEAVMEMSLVNIFYTDCYLNKTKSLLKNARHCNNVTTIASLHHVSIKLKISSLHKYSLNSIVCCT